MIQFIKTSIRGYIYEYVYTAAERVLPSYIDRHALALFELALRTQRTRT